MVRIAILVSASVGTQLPCGWIFEKAPFRLSLKKNLAMTISAEASKPRIKAPRRKTVEVPAFLVYETLDGIPVLYKGWQNVLSKKQKFEEIMAYGGLQWLLITMLKDYLQPILGKKI